MWKKLGKYVQRNVVEYSLWDQLCTAWSSRMSISISILPYAYICLDSYLFQENDPSAPQQIPKNSFIPRVLCLCLPENLG